MRDDDELGATPNAHRRAHDGADGKVTGEEITDWCLDFEVADGSARPAPCRFYGDDPHEDDHGLAMLRDKLRHRSRTDFPIDV
jgi:hypothetical protein